MTFQFEIVQCDCCGKLLTEKDGCTPKVFVNCSENKLRQTLRKNGWSVDLCFTKCPKCQKV